MSTFAPPAPVLANYFLDVEALSLGDVVIRDGYEWLCFTRPTQILTTKNLDDVGNVINQAQTHVDTGGWAAGFVAYDAGPAFDQASQAQPGDQPLIWFALYDKAPVRYCELAPSYREVKLELGPVELSEDAYRQKFLRVKDALRQGESYQVNLTMRQPFKLQTGAARLFESRCGVSPPPYAGFIQGGDWQVVSFSPELFFERVGTTVVSRPMKGTAPHPGGADELAAARRTLSEDPKTIAENIMIVDMVRSDLGAVAQPGSVRVPRLLEVAPHRGLLQMTSIVTANTRVSTVELFRKLFPPASVTGAPKVSTCKLIAELELSPRGIYCGAIGFMSPGRQRFSVAIRTAWIDSGSGEGEFGIGSGIVWDSEPDAEYAECLIKRDFLLNSGEPWALLESIPQHGLGDRALVEKHIRRLETSANRLAIPLDREGILHALMEFELSTSSERRKVRLRLRRDGSFDVSVGPSAIQKATITAALATETVDSTNLNLRLKTTSRAFFQQQLDAHPDVDEVLLYNERGELTEFSRGNAVLRLDGRLVTPDPDVGCLAGVGIAHHLDGAVEYARPTVDDLTRCTGVFFVNSVAGLIEVAMRNYPPRDASAPGSSSPNSPSHGSKFFHRATEVP